MGKKKYNTEEERKAAKRASNANYYQEHRDDILSQKAEHYQQNRNEIRAQQAEYYSTPKGRAVFLLQGYRRYDRKYNRGECTLTADWIVNNIFTQPCAHCGCSDWRQIGCNRLDNNLPHTPDNVEPCCGRCNVMLGADDKCKPVYQYNLDGLLVAIWPSVSECGRNGYDQGTVTNCCNGKRKAHKGYKWSYELI